MNFSRVNFTSITFKYHLSAKRAVQVTLFTGINTNIRTIINLIQLIPSTVKSASAAVQIILDLARFLNWNAVRNFSSSLMWRPTASVCSSAFGLSHCDLITANTTFVGFPWNFVKEYFKRIAKQVWISWPWPREKSSTLTSYMAWGIWLQFGIGEFHVILLSSCEIRQQICCDFYTLLAGLGFLKMNIITAIFYLRTWTFSCTFQIHCHICVEFSIRNQQKIVLVYLTSVKIGIWEVVLVLRVCKRN